MSKRWTSPIRRSWRYARLVPSGLGPDDQSGAGERVAFATAVREEIERRKRASQLFTYDDMLTRLRDALADPERGTAAADRLRRRYLIVMVDEFQDTDPIQWEILHRTFHRHSTLILIGDPKQAIYAFRGADVFSYLDAVQQAHHVRSLAVNGGATRHWSTHCTSCWVRLLSTSESPYAQSRLTTSSDDSLRTPNSSTSLHRSGCASCHTSPMRRGCRVWRPSGLRSPTTSLPTSPHCWVRALSCSMEAAAGHCSHPTSRCWYVRTNAGRRYVIGW